MRNKFVFWAASLIITASGLMNLTACRSLTSEMANKLNDTKTEITSEVVEGNDDVAPLNADVKVEEDKELSDEEIFKEFLALKRPGVFKGVDYLDENNSELYLDVFLKACIISNLEAYKGKAKIENFNYEFIDIGDNGSEELVVFIDFSDDYEPRNATLTFAIENNEVVLINEISEYFRTGAIINSYGIICESYKYNQDESEYYSYLYEDGSTEKIYNDELYSMAPDEIEYLFGSDVANRIGEKWDYFYRHRIDINDMRYTFYLDIDGNEYTPIIETGEALTPYAEVKEVINKKLEHLGLNEEKLYAPVNFISIDPEFFNTIKRNTWNEAYEAMVSSRYNVFDLLEESYDSGQMVEPIVFTGYSVADVNDDGVPELLFMAQPCDMLDYKVSEYPNWICFTEYVFAYKYNDISKNLEYLGYKRILASDKNYDYGVPADSFTAQYMNNRLETFGVYNNCATFVGGTNSEVSSGGKVEVLKWGVETIFSDFEEFYFDDYGDENKYMADFAKTADIVNGYKPLMFYKFSDMTALDKLKSGEIVTDAVSYSDEDVVKVINESLYEYAISDKEQAHFIYPRGQGKPYISGKMGSQEFNWY